MIKKKLTFSLSALILAAGIPLLLSGCATGNYGSSSSSTYLPGPCGFKYNCCMEPAQAAPAPAPAPAPAAVAAPAPAAVAAPAPAEQPAVVQPAPKKASWLDTYDIEAASNNLLFGNNKSSLTYRDITILKRDAEYLDHNPGMVVSVVGNCDANGSVYYNKQLGMRRAIAAKEYLEKLGINGDRLKTASNGKEKPVCTAHTSSCNALNRNVHFVIVSR